MEIDLRLSGGITVVGIRGSVDGLTADDLMRILDETSQVIEYSRRLEEKSQELERATAELRQANQRLQELDRLVSEACPQAGERANMLRPVGSREQIDRKQRFGGHRFPE